MPSPRTTSGWQAIALVAITYVYFLIFAQFAFLKRLDQLGIADTHLQIVMAAMAFGGILFSLLATRQTSIPAARRLQVALAVCAAAALLSTLPLNLPAAVAISALIGSGLGLLTVTLVSHLDLWLGSSERLLKVGLGTGIGYFACNIPALFTATPGHQAITAAALTLLGILAASSTSEALPGATEAAPATLPFPLIVLAFTALIWLDSAAFFIIQATPALKAGTWQGTIHLWTNGSLHLAAAILSAWLLRRRGLPLVLALAVLALASACLLLLDPSRALLASAFYPIGVSLYSVALVAYPSLLLTAASRSQRARRAGIIYAVAGWFGSAMGIGMAQHLGHVPVAFVAFALLLVLGPQLPVLLRARRREIGLSTLAILAAFAIARFTEHTPPASTPAERGHQVYIAQGCISCHSQYVRPNTHDVLLWGPTQTITELRSQHPPLIGNRRQGPDLSEVGSRRSPLWLRAHLEDPRQLSPSSFMPSYDHLFTSSTRGEDLVAYLTTLQTSGTPQHIALELAWHPAPTPSATAAEGAILYSQYCATCHNPQGSTRTRWRNQFHRLPADLAQGPWLDFDPAHPNPRLAQIIKFGIPGSDMPGHEYFTDQQVQSLTLWLKSSFLQPGPSSPHQQIAQATPGETR